VHAAHIGRQHVTVVVAPPVNASTTFTGAGLVTTMFVPTLLSAFSGAAVAGPSACCCKRVTQAVQHAATLQQSVPATSLHAAVNGWCPVDGTRTASRCLACSLAPQFAKHPGCCQRGVHMRTIAWTCVIFTTACAREQHAVVQALHASCDECVIS
jgi:hypothetical protein